MWTLNQWKGLKRLEKVLIFVCIILSMCIILLACTSSNTSDSDTCTSDECYQTANRMWGYINPDADPCEDFYEYACGGWIKHNPIPKDKTEWSLRYELSENIAKQLQSILESKENYLNYSTKLFENMQNYYKACSNEKQRNENGVTQLHNLLLDHYSWPMIDTNWKKNIPDYRWTDHFIKLNEQFQANYLIKLSLLNFKKHVVQVEPGSLGIDDFHLKDDTKVEAYRQFIRKSAQIMQKSVPKSSNPTFQPNFTSSYYDEAIEELIEFEKKLASIRQESNPTQITFSKFQDKYKIDLLKIVSKTFPEQLSVADDQLYIVDEKYFEQLHAVLKTFKNETIANYMAWRTVQLLGASTNSEFRNVIFEYSKAVQEVNEMIQYERGCLEETSEIFSDILGLAYVFKHYNMDYVGYIRNLANYIRSTLLLTFQWLDWVDEMNRIKLIFKVTVLKEEIGLPAKFKYLEMLENIYSKLETISSDNYFQSYLKVSKWFKMLPFIYQQTDDQFFTWNPKGVIATYFVHFNLLTIPAALQQPPFYSPEMPPMINFATMGTIIGHEFTHSIDSKGIEYDTSGQKMGLDNEQTEKEFKKRCACFVEQYSNYHEPLFQKKLNGSRTLNENLADNGGLALSYYAYQMYRYMKGIGLEVVGSQHTQKFERLPRPMDKFSSDQQFFIAYASTFCSNQRKESLKNMLTNSLYIPNKHRVNGAVSNFDPFAKTFQCKVNTQMNPATKCHLW